MPTAKRFCFGVLPQKTEEERDWEIQNLKKKLILLFDEYPFEPGEYSFVRTELKKLVECFEVHIISVSPSAEQKMPLDERIILHHCMRKFDAIQKVKAIVRFLFSSYGIGECKRILKSGQNIAGRFYDAVVYFASAEQLLSYVKKNRIITGNELVYSYWFNANCLAFLMEKKQYPNLRVVSRIHGYDLYEERTLHGRQPFREVMDKAVDRLFFVADTGLQYYIRHWGDTKEIDSKYIVAPIGTTDTGFQGEIVKERMDFHIVSCSHVIPLKRVSLIIEGLALITDMEIRWTHFGTGSHYDETERYAREMLSHKKNISFEMSGFVPVEEIKRFYAGQWIDCFLTVSSTEGSPVSIQEAMAYGIPIIGTAVGEIPHMIDGNGILLSENPAPEEIRDAIMRLYQATEAETRQMHEKSRQLWENTYNALENAEKFVNDLT